MAREASVFHFELIKSARVPSAWYRIDDLCALAEFVLQSENVVGPSEITLDLTNPERIQSLNRRFRGVDRTTDVIAFRYDNAELTSVEMAEKHPQSRRGSTLFSSSRQVVSREPAVFSDGERLAPGSPHTRRPGPPAVWRAGLRPAGATFLPTFRPQLDDRGVFGDVAINITQAAAQAKKIGHSTRREIRLLLIHGILHLLGYTDYEPVPRRRMFRRQNELLRRWERRAR